MADSGPMAGLTAIPSGRALVASGGGDTVLSAGGRRGRACFSWHFVASNVQDDVAVRPGAADQHVPRRLFQRIRGVGDAAGEQGVVHLCHTLVRHFQRVGMSQASASSRTLCRSFANGAEMPLRGKVTSGPVPGGPGGWSGGRPFCPARGRGMASHFP
jgi:hypothetical protein